MADNERPGNEREEARRRFERLAGGLLQVDPDELEDEEAKKAPSETSEDDASEAEEA